MPHSGVQLKLDRERRVSPRSAARPRSARARTTCSWRCVAEVLGIDPFDIRAVTGDTDLTPVDLGCYSSRVTLMMGNAAIEAAERARELLAAGGLAEAGRAGRARLVFAGSPRVRRARTPSAACRFAEAVVHGRGAASARSARPAATRRRGRRRSSRAAASGPRPRTRTRPRVVEVEVDPRHRLDPRAARSGSPTTSAARSTRRWSRGQVEGSVYMGLGRGADGGAGVPPPAASPVERRWCTSSRRCSSTRARPCSRCRRSTPNSSSDPDPRGPFGAKEVGQGPLAADHAGRGQRGVRRGRRADRRGAGHARRRSLKALAAEGRGQARARRSQPRFRTSPWPETLMVPPPWEGGDGRAVERAGDEVHAQGRGRRRGARRGCAHDAPAGVHLPRAAHACARRQSGWRTRQVTPSLVAGGTDLLPNMKRRQQMPSTVIGLRGVASCATRRRDGSGVQAGAPAVTLARSHASPAGARRRSVPRSPACGRPRSRSPRPSAQHGHDRRQPVPRHPLHLLRPDLRVAQGHRLLHEEGRPDLLGGPVEPALPGGLVDRHRRRCC